LTAALADKESFVRWEAAAALGAIGPAAKDAVPALTKALADSSSAVRRNAAEALGTIGAGTKADLAAPRKAAKDPEATVQDAAVAGDPQNGPGGGVAIMGCTRRPRPNECGAAGSAAETGAPPRCSVPPETCSPLQRCRGDRRSRPSLLALSR